MTRPGSTVTGRSGILLQQTLWFQSCAFLNLSRDPRMRAFEVFSLERSGLADDDLRHTGFVNVRTHEEPMAWACIWE